MRTIDANTRDQILANAQKVFAEVGYKEATVRQICKAAKANVCLVSYYFGGKEGLYKSVFQRLGEERLKRAESLLGQSQNIESKEEFRVRLQILLEQMFLTQVARPDEVLIMQREMLEGTPRVQETLQQFVKTIRKYFVDFIEYGIKKKYLKKGLDPLLTAITGINIVMGFATHLSGKKDHVDFFFPGIPQKDLNDRITKTFIPIFIDGVMNHENQK